MTSPPKSPESRAGFRATLLRILDGLRPERVDMSAVLALAVLVVAMTVTVPALLGRATDLIVDGVHGDGIDAAELRGVLILAGLLAAAASGCQVIQGRLIATAVQWSR